jgi:hypothetical protein
MSRIGADRFQRWETAGRSQSLCKVLVAAVVDSGRVHPTLLCFEVKTRCRSGQPSKFRLSLKHLKRSKIQTKFPRTTHSRLIYVKKESAK